MIARASTDCLFAFTNLCIISIHKLLRGEIANSERRMKAYSRSLGCAHHTIARTTLSWLVLCAKSARAFVSRFSLPGSCGLKHKNGRM